MDRSLLPWCDSLLVFFYRNLAKGFEFLFLFHVCLLLETHPLTLIFLESGSAITSLLQKPNSNHPNPNSTLNHAPPIRQKSNPNSTSMRRGGGGGGSSSGASTNGEPPTPLSPPVSAETAQIIPDKPSGPEPSPTDHPNKSNSNWDHGLRRNGFTPKQHGSGDHHGGYGGNRRGNSGGGGSHHGSYRSRRDHERGGYDWNPPRGFSGRDAHMLPPPQQQRGHPRPFPMQPPPSPAPFVNPPQVRPFLGPMGFAGKLLGLWLSQSPLSHGRFLHFDGL